MATKRVNIDIVAKDKSQRALQGVRGSLDRVKASVFNVRNALVGLGGGLVIRSLVNTGKEIESLKVRLKFLFGSAEEGAKAFDEMAKFAAKVPFSLEQIQQGAGVLSVVSKDADELADILEITGNVAAVTGLDFRTASEQIQRSLSAGIASADLFREKGVRDLLGFKAGATVTADETAEAFERVFGKGGRFGGATDELALTLEGTLSMIGDKFFTFKKTILEAGFFPELKKQFKDLDNFLQENTKTLDELAIKIGKGLAIAVRETADAFKFLKNNFDGVVLVLQTMVAIKVATFFYGATTALAGLTTGMKLFNMATKKNIIFGSVMVFASALGFMISKFQEFKGELIETTKTTTELEKEIADVERKLNRGLNVQNLTTELNLLKNQLAILREEEARLNTIHTEHMRLSSNIKEKLIEINEERLKETKILSDNNEHMRVKNKLTAEQAGLFDHLSSTTAEHNEHMRVANRLTAEQAGLIPKVNEDLAQHNEHMRIKNRLTAEQAGLIPKQISDELAKQNEHMRVKNKLTAEQAGLFDEKKQLDALKKEREQSQNNQQKMFDDALENNAKMVALKKQGNQDIFDNTKSSLQALSGLNRTAFEAFKRFQIAEATINAVKAASTAFTTHAGNPFLATAVAASHLAKGMAMVAQIKSTNYRAGGGSVNKDQAYMVGEKGPEMFVPSGSGKIVPNNQMRGGQPVNVNFNINTVDARGFNELLTNSRGVIVNMINSAVNETGKQAIV